MGEHTEIVGSRIGSLMVIKKSYRIVKPQKSSQVIYLARCNCGKELYLCRSDMKKRYGLYKSADGKCKHINLTGNNKPPIAKRKEFYE